jgi:hypothetical protein
MSTSSARPIDLFFYADTSERLNALLRNEASRLHVILEEFQRTCTEYGRVIDGDLDASLRALTNLHDARAVWVRQVAWDFTKANAGALVDNVGAGLTSLFQFGVQVESQIGSAASNLGRQMESLQEGFGHTANSLFETGYGWLHDASDFGKGVISDAAEGVNKFSNYVSEQTNRLTSFIEAQLHQGEEKIKQLQEAIKQAFEKLGISQWMDIITV